MPRLHGYREDHHLRVLVDELEELDELDELPRSQQRFLNDNRSPLPVARVADARWWRRLARMLY